ncbi:MAG: hypothetical protein WD738_18855 [Pirellulales bacterium]
MAISTKTSAFVVAALASVWAAALVGLPGCGRRSAEMESPPSDHAAHDDHAHDHGHEGPHGGHIIELGTEEHHAELTHDDEAHRIGIYLLGSDAKTAAPIVAESVTINVSVDGQASQYILPAVAQPGEPTGKSSYFELVSEPLCAVVCGESEASKTHARLGLTIDGKPYVGLIETEAAHEHDHDHADGHGHSHAGDDALMWRQEIDEQGYHIALGHHGRTLAAGHEVEPAVQITRDGQPVADAQVFNALLAGDGKTVLSDEAATVYEPPTSEEPAHYAQGALKIPADTRQVVIRYRIVLPEGSGERTFDVPVAIE